jgi:penicillin amidase
VNDIDPRLKAAPLLALRWTATDAPDGTFEALFHVNTASTFAEFRAAFKTYGAPAQNFVYADTSGHIGYVLPGRIPIRADPRDAGLRVRSGSDGQHDWTRMIPFKDLPWQLDPPTGLIVTANNAAVDAKYPYLISKEWDPGDRAERITELLSKAAATGGVDTQTLRDIQYDDVVSRAAEMIPLFGSMSSTTTPEGALVAERVHHWPGFTATTDSAGCAAYLVFEYRLARAVFDDELGPLARDYVGSGASIQALIAILKDPASSWWDDVTTKDRVETRDQIVSAALDEAGRELKATLGDAANWTWGNLHQARFTESTLGESGIGPLEWYFDKGPFPAPGAAGAINNSYYRLARAYADPYDPTYLPAGLDQVFSVTTLPSFRLSIDMGDLDGARIIQTTGQSGNPFDRHYGDMIARWLAGETVPLPFSPTAIHAKTAETLVLTPRSGG